MGIRAWTVLPDVRVLHIVRPPSTTATSLQSSMTHKRSVSYSQMNIISKGLRFPHKWICCCKLVTYIIFRRRQGCLVSPNGVWINHLHSFHVLSQCIFLLLANLMLSALSSSRVILGTSVIEKKMMEYKERERAHGGSGLVKQTQWIGHPGYNCLCPMWNKKSMLTYLTYVT